MLGSLLVCIWATCMCLGHMYVSGPHGCIWATWMYLGRMDVSEPHVCIWATCMCLGHMYVSGPHVCVWATCMCLGHMYVSGPHVCVWATWMCLGHMYVSGPHGCIWATCMCLGHMYVSGYLGPPHLGHRMPGRVLRTCQSQGLWCDLLLPVSCQIDHLLDCMPASHGVALVSTVLLPENCSKVQLLLLSMGSKSYAG